MNFEPRERAILEQIHKKQTVTIAEIAKHLKVSNKTISNSLNQLALILTESDVELVRKPNVGVSLKGSKEAVESLINDGYQEINSPETQEERIAYIVFSILKQTSPLPKQELLSQLFISKSTLEKDLARVKQVFEDLGLKILIIPKKGIQVDSGELNRCAVLVSALDYFYHSNWKIIQVGDQLLPILKDVPQEFLKQNTANDFKLVAELLSDFLTQEGITIRDESYQFLILYLLVSIEQSYGDEAQLANLKKPEETTRAFWNTFSQSVGIEYSDVDAICFQDYLKLHRQKSEKHIDEERKIKRILDRITKNTNEQLLDVVVNHIREALVRAKHHNTVRNPNVQDIKKNYALAFEDSLGIAEELKKLFEISLIEDEVAFIALHIQVLKEHENTQAPITAVLISASGQGVFQFLMARLRKIFPNLLISRIINVQEIGQKEITEDLVLSTLDITLPGYKVIKLSPILSASDIEEISTFQANFYQKKAQIISEEFSELVQKEFIFLDEKINTIGQAILFLGQKLIAKGYAKEGFIESCLEREQLSFTSLDSFSTPHPLNIEEVNKPVIAFMRVKNELIWGKEKVKYIFMMCVRDRSIKELERIYSALLKIIDSPDQEILLRGNLDEIFDYLANNELL
ncbi:BglG family transcription antiterminator [Lactococcus garvieae]|uniref:Transcription antiterminator, BglG family n=1 Tax=Lactococcus garvieae DCC43 TaxID=1231377 RepID=K2PSP3_9LACT|nr:PTS sugar transporter subunit IIA [Lactococcus garvieae]EKF50516.1 Transcription antiterminator, BglG family [Lactococcus garvieae DCC43]